MREIHIGPNEADKRLDRFLTSYFKEASAGFIYKMLRKKNITLNGKKADGTEKLKSEDVIKVFFSDETFEKLKGDSGVIIPSGRIFNQFGQLPVIYEDENIVLVNKPFGVLSQKAAATDISLNEWLIDYLLEKGEVTGQSLETYRPSICNRLDRNTTGLVICAKSLIGARKMNSLISERAVDKFYRTIVSGRLTDRVTLKGYLSKDEKANKVDIKKTDPGKGYSYIETVYEPVSYLSDKDLTVLEVKLVTGKPHQIRAHLSSIGHPIIGDVKYGGKKVFSLNHQLLHSYRIVFPKDLEAPFDNIAGKEFVAELPKEFKKITG
ncbi:RluA family pseudouridine synthase [Butyrivibrio sp. CB08]|uniref:RluA family pseudouridine synthase n=1 Tax=Butyrivibrio sp. CB08 TaxID=2364879 RepID=UPI000EA96F5A|nr:RluA family pseudouridine synthase [Butyrivibrio sp. CB08]RKM62493.1 RluA family pseudouridine synthase [Butyrivibrio sp. CB08]